MSRSYRKRAYGLFEREEGKRRWRQISIATYAKEEADRVFQDALLVIPSPGATRSIRPVLVPRAPTIEVDQEMARLWAS